MDEEELDRMARQVHELCSSRRLSDILVDLKKTKNVELTVNRIFDGGFLEGTPRDPSLKAHVILDSDGEYNQEDIIDTTTRSFSSPPHAHISSTNRDLITIPSSPECSPPSAKRTSDTSSYTAFNNGRNQDPSPSSPPPAILQDTPETRFPVSRQPPSLFSSPLLPLIESDDDNDNHRYSIFDMNGSSSTREDASFRMRASPVTRSTVNDVAQKNFPTMDDDDVILLDDDDVPDKPLRAPRPKKAKTTKKSKPVDVFSTQSSSLSSSLPLDFLKEWKDGSDSSSDDDSEQEENSQVSTGTTKKRKRTSQDKSKQQRDKQKEREEKAQRRKEEQEMKKRQKEQLKAEKEAEKLRRKLLEQANRLRTNRQELLEEMIVDVDKDFASSPRGQLLRQTLEAKNAEMVAMETRKPYTISWRRKCTAEWDDEQQTFVPYPDNHTRIKQEAMVLIFMDIATLCDNINEDRMDTLIDSVRRAAAAGRDARVFLMTEGLQTYYKKKMLLQQREYDRAVRASLGQSSSSSSNSNYKPGSIMAIAEKGPSKEKIEDTLTCLQMMKDVMLVPTSDEADSVDWLISLTADLANAIYKNRNIKGIFKHQAPAKSGVDPPDIWSKMLQEIHLCTPAVAKAVTDAYPTAQSLYRRYKEAKSVEEAEELLADLQVERSVLSNRDRTVNKSMSKRIYTIFTSDDPDHVIA